jgi:general L-amino acid transport system substrate-binding protein
VWFNIAKWSLNAMITAEELGVNQGNVDDMTKSSNPNVQRLLGVTSDMGSKLKLENNWAYNIVKQVGNYGEVFERNVGAESPLKISRGINALWNKGGFLYAPPVR